MLGVYGIFYCCAPSRTSVKDVQYESTFLTVMTLRRLLWMPSRNNVTWKLIGLSNDSSKGNVGPVRCRYCFERNFPMHYDSGASVASNTENNSLYIFWRKHEKTKLTELESGASRDEIHEAVHYPEINHLINAALTFGRQRGIFGHTIVCTFARSLPLI